MLRHCLDTTTVLAFPCPETPKRNQTCRTLQVNRLAKPIFERSPGPNDMPRTKLGSLHSVHLPPCLTRTVTALSYPNTSREPWMAACYLLVTAVGQCPRVCRSLAKGWMTSLVLPDTVLFTTKRKGNLGHCAFFLWEQEFHRKKNVSPRIMSTSSSM